MSRNESIKKINQDFYSYNAESFSSTRSSSWDGFVQLSPYINPKDSVLDIGAGNGRLYSHLIKTGYLGNFIGIDNSSELLNIAQSKYPQSQWHLTDWEDWVNQDTQQYSVITAFGVLHHLSSEEEILTLLDYAYHHSNIFIFSRWNCIMNSTLMKRRVDQHSELGTMFLQHFGVDPQSFSQFEFLFDWKNTTDALRYVRFWTDTELLPLLTKRGWTIVNTWLADGKSDTENTYFVLKKIDASTRTIITN